MSAYGEKPAHLAAYNDRNKIRIVAEKGPHLSIKDGRFTLFNEEGKSFIVPTIDTKYGNYLDAIIASVPESYLSSRTASKRVYYEGSWSEGASAPPTCFSNDLVEPDPEASEPQHSSCALCPHNAWGSRPGSGGKACQEELELVLYVPQMGHFDFRLKSGSFKHFKRYLNYLEQERGAAPHDLVTRMAFVSQGVLMFADREWVSDPQVAVAANDRSAIQAVQDGTGRRPLLPAPRAAPPAPPALPAPKQQAAPPRPRGRPPTSSAALAAPQAGPVSPTSGAAFGIAADAPVETSLSDDIAAAFASMI